MVPFHAKCGTHHYSLGAKATPCPVAKTDPVFPFPKPKTMAESLAASTPAAIDAVKSLAAAFKDKPAKVHHLKVKDGAVVAKTHHDEAYGENCPHCQARRKAKTLAMQRYRAKKKAV